MSNLINVYSSMKVYVIRDYFVWNNLNDFFIIIDIKMNKHKLFINLYN